MFANSASKEARFWRCARAIELLSLIGMSDCKNIEDFEKRLFQHTKRIWAYYCNLNKESKHAIAKLFEETAEIRGADRATHFCGMQSLLNGDDDCGECNACGRR